MEFKNKIKKVEIGLIRHINEEIEIQGSFDSKEFDILLEEQQKILIRLTKELEEIRLKRKLIREIKIEAILKKGPPLCRKWEEEKKEFYLNEAIRIKKKIFQIENEIERLYNIINGRFKEFVNYKQIIKINNNLKRDLFQELYLN